MKRPRIEIAHTGPHKFHARFVAANGETVWTTESYRTTRAAERAIALLFDVEYEPEGRLIATFYWDGVLEVREVDER